MTDLTTGFSTAVHADAATQDRLRRVERLLEDIVRDTASPGSAEHLTGAFLHLSAQAFENVLPANLLQSVSDLFETAQSRSLGTDFVTEYVQSLADRLREHPPRGSALSEGQAAFFVASGEFSAEQLVEEEARIARGGLVALEHQAAIEAINETMTAAEVANLLGISESRVRHRQSKGGLYSFLVARKRRYPVWQFTEDVRQPVLPGLPALTTAFEADEMDPASTRAFMLTKQDDLLVKGKKLTPVEWLARGRPVEEVVDILDGFLMS